MVSLSQVPAVVMALGIGAIFGVVVLNILSNLQSTQTAGSTAYNSTSKAIEGVGNIFEQYGLVGTVVGFAIVLGIVLILWRSFGGQQ